MHTHSPSVVLTLAQRIFGDPAKAAEWLDRPCVQLGGHTPRYMLASEDGMRRVEELLLQIDDDLRRGSA